MLRRIPAVNWAFTRLRPLPHSNSIDLAPVTTGASAAIIEDAAATAQAPTTEISTDPVRDDAAPATQAPAADTAVSVVAENPSDDIRISDDSPPEAVTEVEAPETPPVAEEVLISPTDAENEPVADADLATIGDASPAEIVSVVLEEVVVSSSDVATASTDIPDAVIEAAPSPDVSAEVETVAVEAIPVVVESVAAVVSEAGADSDPALVVEVAPPPANDVPLATAVATAANESASVAIEIEPAPPLESPAPEIRSAPKARARAAEPADRAALIRQRWAETGIRMWNPRLHGNGEATLNIQGSVGLLPPAPGETMPRYDKLEFRMLGGQIVCEGVIVEAPAQASHRSFTRLAEPRNIDRVREPTRERQAVLA
ncbi:hypothetical protein [Bradyrhizobium diversitatis]|uniref:Uncharacterized protein n=1 Tax=Bradyrhizobium diversitatis TaxID=2755406 RepID=A0ABS0PBQ6_9BRAD|nr:hypothetical protein [Bradyrhizobium diversitatis]MBH5390745.1 hypothetical protein [Bradyrhizobium diversitatis]